MADAAALRSLLREDRFLAHELLFHHRHEYQFAPYHRYIIEDFWSPEWRIINLGFRECGKTTLVEEAIAFAAGENEWFDEPNFRNCVIIGAKESLAAELLTNIKVELENNDLFKELYGEIRGDTWQTTKITTRKGYCIQAIGRDQSLRGTKHRDWRPDLVVINDFEDDEEILTPDGRRRTLRWVLRVLLPACDRRRRKLRIYDTVRDADSVPMQLIKRSGWPKRLIPISYLDGEGREQSSWPGHPTLTPAWIAAERQTYAALGEMDIWEREMMMDASTQADRAFNDGMFRVEPVERAWQAVYAMIDPARTVSRDAATTGWAVWSWVNHRLIVWEAGARRLLPDEIIDLAFRIARDYGPVEIGIEADGLNEWLLQPLRARMLHEGVIPVRGQRTPRGKIGFIRGLQPFFSAGQVTFARELPELREQLLGFPTGRIDAPNALAYALNLKPGRLIYEGWNPNSNIAPVEPHYQRSIYLALNARRALVTAVMVQLEDVRLAVLGDWIAEGEPGEVLEGILREASIFAGRKLIGVAGAPHWEQFHNTGLVQAARKLGLEVRPAGVVDAGKALIRRDIGRLTGTGPAFLVSPHARWTLNAFAGGYSRAMTHGMLAEDATEGNYRVLMEGLEATCGLFAWGMDETDEMPQNFAYDSEGRRYRSVLPPRMLERKNARH